MFSSRYQKQIYILFWPNVLIFYNIFKGQSYLLQKCTYGDTDSDSSNVFIHLLLDIPGLNLGSNPYVVKYSIA